MRVWVPGAAADFSSRVNFQFRIPYRVCTTLRVQLHSSTSARTLQISNIGSHAIIWTPENTYTHWQKWVALLLQLLCLTQVRRPEFPARDKEVPNKQTQRKFKKKEKPLQSRQAFFPLKDRNRPLPERVGRLMWIYWPQRPPGGSTGETGSWRRGVFWGSRDETWTWSPWGSAPSFGPAGQSLCSATWCAGPARTATMHCNYPLCLEQNFTVKLCLEEDGNNALQLSALSWAELHC